MIISKDEIQQQVIAILHENCELEMEPQSLDNTSSLQEDIGLDSVDLLTLALEIENHWQ